MSLILFVIVSAMYLISFWITSLKGFAVPIELLSAYECGFEPTGDARTPFEVHYYIVA